MLAALPELKPVSLFVLDIMLPGMDGFEICRLLKSDPELEPIPVLMLTARSAESDKVRGLMIGADDYLTKPFGVREFLARIEALLRRYGKTAARNLDATPDRSMTDRSGLAAPDANSAATARTSGSADPDHAEIIAFGPVRIDDARHRVYLDGAEIEMTNREYELLKYLVQHRGIAYTRDELLNAVWGYEYSGETRTVDVHIRQLRRKVEVDDANPILIETVRGRGYRFTDRLDLPDRTGRKST
jgi:two-component system alkaline phosphatase synthesis response regulator PhoP